MYKTKNKSLDTHKINRSMLHKYMITVKKCNLTGKEDNTNSKNYLKNL